jgi:hypothetical protein
VPTDPRRSLACTTITETIIGSVRRVCRNVTRWRDASMALRWTAAAMLEAAQGFPRLKAMSQVLHLRASLSAHRQKADPAFSVAQTQQAEWFPPTARRSRFSTSSGTSPEFPVAMEAALEARKLGVGAIAGAPSVVRGGSHPGNVAAADMIRAGAVDVLASDYVPPPWWRPPRPQPPPATSR